MPVDRRTAITGAAALAALRTAAAATPDTAEVQMNTPTERVLGIGAFPVNWPIGNGADFRGVFDRHEHANAVTQPVRSGR